MRIIKNFFRTSIPLQGFDKHGRRVLILRGAKADPDRFSMTDQFRANLMVNELLMKDCEDAQGKIESKLKNSGYVRIGSMGSWEPINFEKGVREPIKIMRSSV